MAKCENRPQMHEYMHEMMKIKSKGRAQGSYRLEEREILQKLRRETTKNSYVEPCQRGERENVWKVLNRNFEKVRTELFKRLFHDIRSIENYIRSIEKHSHFKTNESTFSIDRKTGWIDRNGQRLTKFWEKSHFWKTQTKFWKTTPQSIKLQK